MECIKNFLDDSYQYKLRLLAQSRSERYEDTIENYKKIFISHLELVKAECKTSCLEYETCTELRRIVNDIEVSEIEVFFEKLKTIYLLWIDSKTTQSLEELTNLLIEKDLLKFKKPLEKYEVYFKGRVSEEVLTSWDMFHIPFNRRYLIQNQRYSLTGQPMLYLGSSVVDIAEEIDVKNIDNLKMSVVTFRDRELEIYDLRSNVTEILNSIWVDKFLDCEIEYNKADFFKMILSSICSFQRRRELKGFSFCEEYVLPQLLAQVLKIKGYDGIAYYSTKYYENVSCSDNSEINMAFKENLAIFTNLDTHHVYDKKLYEKLFISVPIDKNKIFMVTMDDLREIKNEINQIGNQGKTTSADKIFSAFERIYGKMMVNDKKYTETEYGRLHMYEIYNVLNQILVD